MKSDSLSRTYAALADPTRRAILSRLALGRASVGELAEPFEMSLPAVSRHLRVLSEAGLVRRERDAQWRRCSLSAGPLRDAADWIEQYRPFWEGSFDRLDVHLSRRGKDASGSDRPKPSMGKRHPSKRAKKGTDR